MLIYGTTMLFNMMEEELVITIWIAKLTLHINLGSLVFRLRYIVYGWPVWQQYMNCMYSASLLFVYAYNASNVNGNNFVFVCFCSVGILYKPNLLCSVI